MDLYEELLAIIDLFDNEGLEYAICGGIAVAIHGYSRFTKDIDFLIVASDLQKIAKAVKPIGYKFISGPFEFDRDTPKQRTIHRISRVVGEDVFTLDFILVNPNFQTVWNERDVFEWQGRKMIVVSREGLRTMKSLSARDQDLLDLKQLGLITDEESSQG